MVRKTTNVIQSAFKEVVYITRWCINNTTKASLVCLVRRRLSNEMSKNERLVREVEQVQEQLASSKRTEQELEARVQRHTLAVAALRQRHASSLREVSQLRQAVGSEHTRSERVEKSVLEMRSKAELEQRGDRKTIDELRRLSEVYFQTIKDLEAKLERSESGSSAVGGGAARLSSEMNLMRETLEAEYKLRISEFEDRYLKMVLIHAILVVIYFPPAANIYKFKIQRTSMSPPVKYNEYYEKYTVLARIEYRVRLRGAAVNGGGGGGEADDGAVRGAGALRGARAPAGGLARRVLAAARRLEPHAAVPADGGERGRARAQRDAPPVLRSRCARVPPRCSLSLSHSLVVYCTRTLKRFLSESLLRRPSETELRSCWRAARKRVE